MNTGQHSTTLNPPPPTGIAVPSTSSTTASAGVVSGELPLDPGQFPIIQTIYMVNSVDGAIVNQIDGLAAVDGHTNPALALILGLALARLTQGASDEDRRRRIEEINEYKNPLQAGELGFNLGNTLANHGSMIALPTTMGAGFGAYFILLQKYAFKKYRNKTKEIEKLIVDNLKVVDRFTKLEERANEDLQKLTELQLDYSSSSSDNSTQEIDSEINLLQKQKKWLNSFKSLKNIKNSIKILRSLSDISWFGIKAGNTLGEFCNGLYFDTTLLTDSNLLSAFPVDMLNLFHISCPSIISMIFKFATAGIGAFTSLYLAKMEYDFQTWLQERLKSSQLELEIADLKYKELERKVILALEIIEQRLQLLDKQKLISEGTSTPDSIAKPISTEPLIKPELEDSKSIIRSRTPLEPESSPPKKIPIVENQMGFVTKEIKNKYEKDEELIEFVTARNKKEAEKKNINSNIKKYLERNTLENKATFQNRANGIKVGLMVGGCIVGSIENCILFLWTLAGSITTGHFTMGAAGLLVLKTVATGGAVGSSAFGVGAVVGALAGLIIGLVLARFWYCHVQQESQKKIQDYKGIVLNQLKDSAERIKSREEAEASSTTSQLSLSTSTTTPVLASI